MVLSKIVKTAHGLDWDMAANTDRLGGILNSLIRSTVDYLVSDEWRKIKKCADPNCRRLFLDVSRNHSRRW
jgi:predicted RNA-binding Zn ribbon-like protein